MTTNVALFVLAAVFEIGGCFAFWVWIAGRAYAAYGGIYIAASLAWLWVVERQAPTRADVLGAALAIAGALVIIGFAARVR